MKNTPITPEQVAALSSKELEQLLEKTRKAERAEQRKREKAYLKQRDLFIRSMIQQASEASALLRDLKKEVVVRGNELHDLMYEVFQKEPKDLRSFSLTTEDGKYKVEIDRAALLGLDETAEVHIQTVKDVFTEKFGKTNKTMWGIMQRLLIKNSKGDYDPRMVVKLRAESENVNDPRFDAAVDGLAKATYRTGTATYARFYIKNTESNAWVMIPMQFSSI